jgi:SNF2 family DNA or RNA helicase
LAHLDERKGREGDRGPRALFLGAGAKNSSIQGGILIVTPKAKVAAWASLIKNIPDVSLHVQASLSLSQRRKNGVERLARFDVVLTTYDLVRAKEVAMPVRSSSSRHSSMGGSTCSTPQSMSDAGSDAGFLSPLATESGAGTIPGGTAE